MYIVRATIPRDENYIPLRVPISVFVTLGRLSAFVLYFGDTHDVSYHICTPMSPYHRGVTHFCGGTIEANDTTAIQCAQ